MTRTIWLRVRKNTKLVTFEGLAYIFVKMLARPHIEVVLSQTHPGQTTTDREIQIDNQQEECGPESFMSIPLKKMLIGQETEEEKGADLIRVFDSSDPHDKKIIDSLFMVLTGWSWSTIEHETIGAQH